MENSAENGDDWRAQFLALESIPQDASGAEKRQRGQRFEGVLEAMFANAGLDPRTRYRPKGEEIDGSFVFQGRPMLLEAKWTKDPIPASALYQFKGKLDGKLSGTIGVFISMGGYSGDAVDALIAGKSLNLILFDGSEIREIVRPEGVGIVEALAIKLRAAAEAGTPFFSIAPQSQARSPKSQKLLFIVEGAYDLRLMISLAERSSNPPDFNIIPAGGLLNIAPVALAQLQMHREVDRLVIVIDSDGKAGWNQKRIADRLRVGDFSDEVEIEFITLDPTFEVALGITDTPRRRPQPGTLGRSIADLDIDALAVQSKELRRLFRLLEILG
ncbi:restriction endonuclease [Micromonospora sp. NPDC051196]|uniref:restriction endonuclease n=1 Tax=Micromonospora sp. NPDC051196 TaxID=3155281 RepID=UPI0034247F87